MNSAWKQFLLDNNATFESEQRIIFRPCRAVEPASFIMPISHLAVLRVKGQDATAFLQGQITCNLNELDSRTSSFGAFCNAKGRVMSTFIIFRQAQDWLILLPIELLSGILKQLQRYILRSDVQLLDESNTFCMLGISPAETAHIPFELPQDHLAILDQPCDILRLGDDAPRYLLFSAYETARQLWTELTQGGFSPCSSTAWSLSDIEHGIPWLGTETTAEYIPQMLNLDKLGGISFTKGCYTGQEIVARTHYLGKAKRAMYIAFAELCSVLPCPNSGVVDVATGQVVGQVIAAESKGDGCVLLMVLVAEATDQTKLTLQEQPSVVLQLF